MNTSYFTGTVMWWETRTGTVLYSSGFGPMETDFWHC